MMTRSEVIDLLASFFEGRHPFEEVGKLTGHASSKAPSVFSEWLTGLPQRNQVLVVDVLTELVLQGDEFHFRLPEAAFLFAHIANKAPASFSPTALAALENYMAREEIASAWMQDEDSESDDLKDYRTRWRFALSLWNALYDLRSPFADERFRAFSRYAKDPEFARSLELAKKVRDNSPFGRTG
jgi:hypothetical protein